MKAIFCLSSSHEKIFFLSRFRARKVDYSKAAEAASLTRLGDLLHFGQLFKAFGNNYFAQITHILGNFCKVVKICHFSSEIDFGQLL